MCQAGPRYPHEDHHEAVACTGWETSDGLDGEVEWKEEGWWRMGIREICVGSKHIQYVTWREPSVGFINHYETPRRLHSTAPLRIKAYQSAWSFLWMTMTGGTWVCHRGLFLKLVKCGSTLQPCVPPTARCPCQPLISISSRSHLPRGSERNWSVGLLWKQSPDWTPSMGYMGPKNGRVFRQ